MYVSEFIGETGELSVKNHLSPIGNDDTYKIMAVSEKDKFGYLKIYCSREKLKQLQADISRLLEDSP